MKNVTFKTRHALVLSCISLMTCFAMLLGTTFAWFTDSVTSGVNKIIAGNLDVEATYYNGTDFNTSITAKDDIFVTPAGETKGLWEPGHVEVAYLKVSNVGTLHLQYKLGLSPYTEKAGTNMDGNAFNLSDYLMYKVVDLGTTAPTAFYTRETALTAAAGGAALNGFLGTSSQTPIALAPGAETYCAVIVYMPTTVGNEANYKTGTDAPEIDFAVSVVAGQYQSEVDSFDKTYDAAAPLADVNGVTLSLSASGTYSSATTIPTVISDTATTVTATIPAGTTFKDDNGTDVDFATAKDIFINFELVGAATNTATYEIYFSDADGNVLHQSSTNVIKATGKLNTGWSDITAITHNTGTAPVALTKVDTATEAENTFTYDATTGEVAVWVKSFSPFVMKYEAPVASYVASVNGAGYTTFDQALVAANVGDTILLLKDVEQDSIAINSGRDIVLDLGGHKLTTDYLYVLNGALEVKNGTVAGDGYFMYVYSAPSATSGYGSNLKIDADATVNGDIVLWGDPNTNAPGYNAQIDIDGTVNGCIFVSGNMKEGNDVINVTGKINSGSDIGIALNGFATVNVMSGADITANEKGKGTGIEVRAGNLNVTGGTITGHGRPTEFTANGSGTTSTGAGIAISPYDNSNISVSISGGTIKGYTPVYEKNANNTALTHPVVLTVTGGTFTNTDYETNDTLYAIIVTDAAVNATVTETAITMSAGATVSVATSAVE